MDDATPGDGDPAPELPAPGLGPSRWWEQGTDPDYRFSLANERTFLAWIRTALAFVAAAVALEQLVPTFAVHGVRTALSIVLAGFGLVAGAGAYRHWSRNEQAMREERSLPHSPLLLLLSTGLVAVAVVVVLVLLLQTS